MKTTLELPDELMRALKIRAASDNRRLKDVVTEVIKRGLTESRPPTDSGSRRVALPLVECAHAARPGEEMTPERVAETLLEQELTLASRRT
ncbi:MAG TPA: antitoxin [Chloroflexota bacterium]